MIHDELLKRVTGIDEGLRVVALKERLIYIFEQATTGSVDNDVMKYNISTTTSSGETMRKKVREMSWQQIAEALYQILDDMDTYSDMCKENVEAFQKLVLKKQMEKNNYMYSPDGYGLKRIGEAKLKEKSISHMNASELMLVKRYWESLLPDRPDGTEKRWLEEQLADLGNLLQGKPIEQPPYTLEPKLREGTVDHAERELKLAGMFDEKIDDKDGDGIYGSYNIMMAEAVMELMKVFAGQGHSGMSADMTRELFNKLSNFEVLTELTDNGDEWNDVTEFGDPDVPCWQSQRAPASFSTDGGKTYYNLDIIAEADDEVHPSTKDLKLFTSKAYAA